MKLNLDCLPCLLRQSLQTVRLSTSSAELQGQVVQASARLIAECDLVMTPPALAGLVYKKIAEITGVTDPYAEKKEESNKIALSLVSSLRQEIRAKGGDAGFALALRFAIAGNIIDYGAYEEFDIFGTLAQCRDAKFAIDHTGELISAVAKLPVGANVLYLADNCGEIVFDSLLIEQLFEKGLTITVAVKDGAIINDALISDAFIAGLDRYAEVITNGTMCPGTVLEIASKEFLENFRSADLVISKGQGNFESLSEENREIFFLLTVKCSAAAAHIQEISGVDGAVLSGAGEMVVLNSVVTIQRGSL
ncbi:MAG: hypothetical protein COA36_07310 [Desulfotalea sp.]|nr:MAG: hypothetical protein COA36_07310 [Desulfotalea sp.]